MGRKLDSFVAYDTMSVGEAGEHVVTFQTRISGQEIVHAIAGRQHAENVLKRQAPTSKRRLPTEDFRVYCDSFEEQCFSHVDSVVGSQSTGPIRGSFCRKRTPARTRP